MLLVKRHGCLFMRLATGQLMLSQTFRLGGATVVARDICRSRRPRHVSEQREAKVKSFSRNSGNCRFNPQDGNLVLCFYFPNFR